MKFDPGKAWPHPVLRPPSYGDDYPRAEFEVEIDIKRIEGGIAVELAAEFQLSDPDLLKLVETDAARYALLIRSPRTHFRGLLESPVPTIHRRFTSGDLSGRVELMSFLVCTQRLPDFRSAGWHADFNGLTFNIEAGSVLAEDIQKEYWIDTADEAPLGSIFELVESPDIRDGHWECNLDGQRVGIAMSRADSERYKLARNHANKTAEGQYLMNGLYLPALISVLNTADQDAETYEQYRWFSSLNNRLESVGCVQLGSVNADRLIDAQKVLDYPFLKMPLLAHTDIS